MKTTWEITHMKCDLCDAEWDNREDHREDYELESVDFRITFSLYKRNPVFREMPFHVYEKSVRGDVICHDCNRKLMELLKNGKEDYRHEVAE